MAKKAAVKTLRRTPQAAGKTAKKTVPKSVKTAGKPAKAVKTAAEPAGKTIVKKTAEATVRNAVKKTVKKTVAVVPSRPVKKSPKKSLPVPVSKIAPKKVKPAAVSPVVEKKRGEKAESKTASIAADKGLTAAEITGLQTKLLDLRSRLRGEVSTMTSAALKEKDDGQSTVPLHLADVGSDNYEQEQTLSFIESGSNTLFLIEDALMRMKEGTYGICEHCGCNIPKLRLNYVPFASACVKCAEEN
ncbi:MAG: TraR/DksA C4-type zinc finger protein [Planctomycetaceae bacterium]|jgi:DnaK suppressor protein|nr:TraR/DksA C4-type zinc finger protein [Planctomycetaceae bacterium]